MVAIDDGGDVDIDDVAIAQHVVRVGNTVANHLVDAGANRPRKGHHRACVAQGCALGTALFSPGFGQVVEFLGGDPRLDEGGEVVEQLGGHLASFAHSLQLTAREQGNDFGGLFLFFHGVRWLWVNGGGQGPEKTVDILSAVSVLGSENSLHPPAFAVQFGLDATPKMLLLVSIATCSVIPAAMAGEWRRHRR